MAVSLLIIVLGAVGIVLGKRWLEERAPRAEASIVDRKQEIVDSLLTPTDEIFGETRSLEERVAATKQWIERNPERYDEALARLRRLLGEAAGGGPAPQIQAEIQRIGAARQQAMDEVFRDLYAQAEPLLEQNRYTDVAHLYERYRGVLTGATADGRMEMAKRMRADAAKYETRRMENREESAARLDELLDDVVAGLLRGEFGPVHQAVQEAATEDVFRDEPSQIQELAGFLGRVADLDRHVLDTFRGQQGEEVVVRLADRGQLTVTIDEVSGDHVIAHTVRSTGRAGASLRFGFDELSLTEKLVRLGRADNPDVALRKGVMAFRAAAYPHARSFFAETHPVLRDLLVAAVDEVRR